METVIDLNCSLPSEFGCLLEGMALALERRFEPFSQGRGFITPERVEEIETISARHGIFLAPLYNADGPIEHGVADLAFTN